MPRKGNSGFRWVPTGETEKTHVLARPMALQVAATRRTNRWERVSLDLSVREVISIGAGREEVEATLRYDKDAENLMRLLNDAANGIVVDYYQHLAGSQKFSLWLIGEPQDLGPDPSGGGEYMIRVRWRDASASGTGLQRLFSPWWYKYSGGMARGADMTHTRATTANYKNNLGVLTSAVSGALRDGHWVENEAGLLVPSTLLEGARVNKFTQPEDLTHGDWATTGLSAQTANQAGDPEGGTTLDELVENSSLSNHGVRQTKTLTADVNYALSCFYIAGTRTWAHLRLEDTGSPANFVDAFFNLSTGAVGSERDGGTGTSARAYIEDWTAVVAGLYRCVLVGSVGNAATSILSMCQMASADLTANYTGDGASGLFAGFAMLEDNANFASSYHATTRNADFLQDSINFSPADIVAAGGATFYSEWIERGTLFTGADSRIWQLGGAAAGTDPRLLLYGASGSNGRPVAAFDDGTTEATSTAAADTVALSDHVRTRVVVYLDGSDWKVQLHTSVNGAAEVSASAGTIGATLPDDWSADTVTVGADPAGANAGFSEMIVPFLAAPGVQTMAEMSRLAHN
jgi:hypothetical protein